MKTLWTALMEPNRLHIVELLRDGPLTVGEIAQRLGLQQPQVSKHLKGWWAPQPYTMPICTIDLRPGGIWHYSMRSPEGQDHWARSVYREIVPPEKLVYTSTFADKHANPIEGMPEHLTTVIFTQEAGKTRVTARVQFTSAAALSVAVDRGMLQGMSMTWEYLVEYVQELQAK